MSLRRIIRRCLLPKEVRPRRILFGPAAGLRLRIDPEAEFRFWLGLYEAELNRHFRRLVRPGMRCFDVGGAEGYHAAMLARLSGNPVVVFECGAPWWPRIENVLALNGLAGEIVRDVVSDRDADGTVTLDSAARRTFVPDFIKMDIEGAEADALAGARSILDERKPHLIVEVHGAGVEARCIDILHGHGYAPEIVEPRRWLAEDRPVDHNRWLVCVGR